MIIPADLAGPQLRKLYAIFPSADDLPEYECVPADEVPEPYRGLLVHEHHMTVTVETYHHDRVNVRILARHHHGNSYARKILLVLDASNRVVQFGIMRIDLSVCSQQVRDEIVAGKTPLGRILIAHQVLRRIEPTAYLRVIPGSAMMEWFGLDRPKPTYGRLARIHYNEQAAVELLEVVVPA
jgi:chorismate-pyruvate lyase